jgi:thioredoxin reductase (NADPH)
MDESVSWSDLASARSYVSSIIVSMGSGSHSNYPIVKVFGKTGSAPAYTVRDFLYRNGVPFEWTELTTNEQASQIGVENPNDQRLPICVFSDGTRLECPSILQITEKLGWPHDPARSEYDLAIYGAGPAGLSAAVYGASEGLKTIVLERWAVGGQAGSSPRIENYLGFPDGISGAVLAERAREQAYHFGAEILVAAEGIGTEFCLRKRVGRLADGRKIVAKAAICATGITYRKLQLSNEDHFFGAGLYYGAGAGEASLCAASPVVIVGGGNSAGQAALYFARLSVKVTMIVFEESLKSTLSSYLIDRIYETKNINVLTNTQVTALDGDDVLRSITLTNRVTSESQNLETRWLFVCIGGEPRTEWALEAGITRDEEGYLITGPDLLHEGRRPDGWPLDRDPFYLETNMPGTFAAGDVRHGSVKRCASAVGEGAMAVMFVHHYLASV